MRPPPSPTPFSACDGGECRTALVRVETAAGKRGANSVSRSVLNRRDGHTLCAGGSCADDTINAADTILAGLRSRTRRQINDAAIKKCLLADQLQSCGLLIGFSLTSARLLALARLAMPSAPAAMMRLGNSEASRSREPPRPSASPRYRSVPWCAD